MHIRWLDNHLYHIEELLLMVEKQPEYFPNME